MNVVGDDRSTVPIWKHQKPEVKPCVANFFLQSHLTVCLCACVYVCPRTTNSYASIVFPRIFASFTWPPPFRKTQKWYVTSWVDSDRSAIFCLNPTDKLYSGFYCLVYDNPRVFHSDSVLIILMERLTAYRDPGTTTHGVWNKAKCFEDLE